MSRYCKKPRTGVVYEKDLGATTPPAAASMSKFDSDKSWKEVARIR